mmetsp:Transcript_14975/g.25014  ORF Transcript_14975/g.25014 Transcript_14975/m.25014 type:complete len:439 (+) Transcript_14975:144-1460(+)|eukprot:CAMPEP_0119350370 /NCGR_PEP_ID=MMETSP1333-20130426/110025_1 /TAXON_ID=418940 /ORGANISM="Scyphosphaera apsteinii, Strain RCC1455" /LENGTH=438 /DNA_ID=CAMNT_0007362987 /DNA_START=143 /DNA_END=1459 /DNA_ORIENTATION=+
MAAPACSRIKWKVDHDKSVLISNFERRGWARAVDDGEWNIYWASPYSIKQIFSPENGMRLQDGQLVNHFPNHYELTRKDLMVKNLKRYRKELERVVAERAQLEANSRSTEFSSISDRDLEFIPTTFILPADYALLAEEFRRSPNSMWIMKPTSKSRGIGIFIVNRLSQVRKWMSQRNSASAKDAYVCSRYITNPLLIGGKKFDLRIYVLVLSYRPLKVYTYRRGFARFCTFNYTNEAHELDNELVHLTNVAIQKQSADYSHTHGWKWGLKNLLAYIEGTRGLDAAEALMESVGWVIVHSLKACQNVMIHDKHCFECYGYDIMLDNELKPWLLEVNASPSLTTTTTSDRILKTQLISEVLDLAVPANFPESGRPGVACSSKRSTSTDVPTESSPSSFELLYDEGAEIEAERAERVRKETEAARRKGSKAGVGARRGSSL